MLQTSIESFNELALEIEQFNAHCSTGAYNDAMHVLRKLDSKLWKLQQYDLAVELYEKIRGKPAESRQRLDSFYYLGMAYNQAKQYQKAIASYQSALEVAQLALPREQEM